MAGLYQHCRSTSTISSYTQTQKPWGYIDILVDLSTEIDKANTVSRLLLDLQPETGARKRKEL
ncbi:hypothetical protein N7478_011131 [Penicillium angulare]|uniref:uncharacterized protein n=1 Tax=Penicillium angulare TaxID=116970 RepID=UPI00254070FD|nr:uncharacterized protein N7478_011131 [Penicillium angulare]KAJ5263526.1 hypothetical protein N7478_011131 [Penicillium angulare]